MTLPLLKPAILVALIFRTLDAFRVFDLIYVLTGGGPGTSTEPIALYTFNALLQNLRFGYGSALSVIVFVVTFGLALGLHPAPRRRAHGDAAVNDRKPVGRPLVLALLVLASAFPVLLGASSPRSRPRPGSSRRPSLLPTDARCSITTARSSPSATSGCRSGTR